MKRWKEGVKKGVKEGRKGRVSGRQDVGGMKWR